MLLFPLPRVAQVSYVDVAGHRVPIIAFRFVYVKAERAPGYQVPRRRRPSSSTTGDPEHLWNMNDYFLFDS